MASRFLKIAAALSLASLLLCSLALGKSWFTMGYSGTLTTATTINNTAKGLRMVPADTGTVESVYVYIDFTWTDAYQESVKCALYASPVGGSSVADTLKDSTNQRIFTNGQADGWYGFTFIQHARCTTFAAPKKYVPYAWGSLNALSENAFNMERGANTGDTVNYKAMSYGAWPATIGSKSAYGNYRAMIYVVYSQTPPAAGSSKKKRWFTMGGGAVP